MLHLVNQYLPYLWVWFCSFCLCFFLPLSYILFLLVFYDGVCEKKRERKLISVGNFSGEILWGNSCIYLSSASGHWVLITTLNYNHLWVWEGECLRKYLFQYHFWALGHPLFLFHLAIQSPVLLLVLVAGNLCPVWCVSSFLHISSTTLP